jgi:dienelactone hydrolase
MRFHVERILAFLLVGLALNAAAAVEEVTLPGPGIELSGRLYRPPGEGPFPAIVMMHGCSGMWGAGGREPTANYRAWATHFSQRGYVALLLDSFRPRGEREICTQKERKVSEARDRPRDAYAALAWLAARKDVDGKHIHVMGWSNGAMAVLNVLRPDAPGRLPDGPAFTSAVALYPGCAALARGSYHPVAPLLILSGAADDWTPARSCEALAQKAAGDVRIEVYEGAHHGFDSPVGAVHLRPEVRNLSSPTGWGATVGPNPVARAKALEAATAFIAAH